MNRHLKWSLGALAFATALANGVAQAQRAPDSDKSATAAKPISSTPIAERAQGDEPALAAVPRFAWRLSRLFGNDWFHTSRYSSTTAYRPVIDWAWEDRYYTCYRTQYEPVCEEREAVCYRNVVETAYRECRYEVRRPIYETAEQEVRYKVCRPVWETHEEERTCTVLKPVYETTEQECRYTVTRPVWETEERECRYVRYRPVWETAERERCYTTCEPVTAYRTVREDCGQWEVRRQYHPGPVVTRYVQEPGRWVYDPCTGCCFYQPGECREVQLQCAGYYTCQRMWVPNIVERKIPYTTYVTRVHREKVPVRVCRMVCETVTQKVPVRVCRMVQEEVVKKVPVTTCRWIREQRSYKVPVRVCRMVEEEVVKKIPVTTCRWVTEERVEKVPYQVCKRVPYTVRYTTTRWVARKVPVTYRYRVCRPVCRLVPTSECQPLPAPADCAQAENPAATPSTVALAQSQARKVPDGSESSAGEAPDIAATELQWTPVSLAKGSL